MYYRPQTSQKMIANPNIKGVEDANVPLDFSEIFWICFWGSEHKFPNLLLCATCLHFVDGWFFIEILAVWVLHTCTCTPWVKISILCVGLSIQQCTKWYIFSIWKNVIKHVYHFVIIVRYMTWSSSFIHLKKRNNVYNSLQNTDWIR